MWVVELEGFNDGVPYEHARYSDKGTAHLTLGLCKERNPKVRWRLIEIIEDFS